MADPQELLLHPNLMSFARTKKVITSLYGTQKDKERKKNQNREGMARPNGLFESMITSESTITGRLRGEPGGLAIRHWTSRSCRALREHQSGATQDRGVILLNALSLLPVLALFIILLEHLDRARLLAQEVDHEGHGEVVQTLAP